MNNPSFWSPVYAVLKPPQRNTMPDISQKAVSRPLVLLEIPMEGTHVCVSLTHTVDGSEILHHLIGSLSHCLQVGGWPDFFQQYHQGSAVQNDLLVPYVSNRGVQDPAILHSQPSSNATFACTQNAFRNWYIPGSCEMGTLAYNPRINGIVAH